MWSSTFDSSGSCSCRASLSSAQSLAAGRRGSGLQTRVECQQEPILIGGFGFRQCLLEVELQLLGQAAEACEEVPQTALVTNYFVVAVRLEQVLQFTFHHRLSF